MEKRTFSPADYVVFGMTLGVSAVIGIFYAIRDRNSKAGTEGYLMAGRSMSTVPVAMSLIVSFISAITILGAPAEVYLYGSMYWWHVIVFLLVAIVVSQLYIPTFYRLGISSTYEYLERRFSRPVRILGTLSYIVESILYIGIVIYAPALALNEVTGFNLWMAVLTTGLVCIFYTTLGGLKAVIWTDVFQALVMVCGFLAVIIQGSSLQGGFGKVWEICDQAGRVDFVHFEADPRVRNTIWSLLVGATVMWLGVYAVNQSQVQRYLCCKSARQACCAIFINAAGLFVIISLACMCGMVMFAYYSDCDPLTQGCVGASDQLLPYLVMEILHQFPGVPGLFVSCVYSGCLSTVSSGINGMATVTIEDFIRPVTSWKERTYTWVSKGLVILFGLACIAMAVLASYLGEVLQAALSIFGLIGGPRLGLFTLGVVVPFGNSIGAFVGLIVGLFLTSWAYIGSKMYPPLPEFTRRMYLNTTACPSTCYFEEISNETTTAAYLEYTPTITSLNMTTPESAERPALADFYSISYFYISVVGMLGTLITGMIVSLLTGGWKERKNVDPNLMTPLFDVYILKWLPEKFRYVMRCCIPPRQSEDDLGSQKLSPMTMSAEISPLVAQHEEKNYGMPYYLQTETVSDSIEKTDRDIESLSDGIKAEKSLVASL